MKSRIRSEPLSLDDYMASPYLIAPLRRHDFTMVSDGGAALIVTSAERAADFPKTPVHLIGMAEHAAISAFEREDNVMRPWLGQVAERLYADAGVSRADIDVLFIQDPFSVYVLDGLEAYGFCGAGEAGAFIQEGHTRLGGSMPCNTDGGLLSGSHCTHPSGMHTIEVVRQLRGECGDRQVPNARIGISLAQGMAVHGHAGTLIMARD